MLKSRAGYILGAAALILAVSPEARRAVRGWAVKGVEAVLDLSDQVKGLKETVIPPPLPTESNEIEKY